MSQEEEKEEGNSSVLATSAGTWAIFVQTARTLEEEREEEQEEHKRPAQEEREEHCKGLEEYKEEEDHSTGLLRRLRPRLVIML